MQAFDPVTTPLHGINLIQAGAGTGKTYTIATLVVRLIIEHGLSIRQILVVTFTEAATEELRDRVRKRLQETLTALRSPSAEGEGDVVLSAILANVDDKTVAARRLENALRGFDEAAVFTIHGFCRRMLQDNAFESGILFDTELVADQYALLREISEDFWRTHFYEAEPLFVAYVLEQGYGPQPLQELLGNHTGKPLLHIVPDSTEISGDSGPATAFQQAFAAVSAAWPAARPAVAELLKNHPGLNRNAYKPDSVPDWLETMGYFCSQALISTALPACFDKFCSDTLRAKTKKKQEPPAHAFFDLCQSLKNARETLATHYEQRLAAIKRRLFDDAASALAVRKQRRNIRFFDDLLRGLYDALHGNNGETLAKAIHKQFPAALIDEFQDTDPLQYAIFQRIYASPLEIPPNPPFSKGGSEPLPPLEKADELPPPLEKGGRGGFEKQPPLLFLIGDPKQAIYSFRGADIFAYLQAVRDADSHYTLLTNWRSQPDLLRALNALFKGTDKPFLFKEIDFRDAKPAKADTPGHPDLPGAPLHVWRISRDMANTAPDKAIAKAWAEEHLPLLVTGEIVRLLNEAQQPPPFEKEEICKSPPAPLFQGGRLHAGDIAILVRSNRQAHLMQAALRERHVPAVLYSRESLFAGHEAREMAQLLAALTEPARPRPLRAALCTDMLGWDGNQLHVLEEDEIRWEQVLERFRGYHAAWLGRGFMPMFRELLIRESVLPRLAAYVDGERRLTNVLHLGEVLQQAWATQEHAPPRLYRWLQMRMARHAEESDEYQLRLESDARAVKLVTIHKSKGLEYPVVFVPFAWDSRFHALKATEFTFHDAEQDGRLTLDIGSPDQDAHRAPALQEELAESLRLLYVAVTRAKYRCYLVSGGFNSGIPKEYQAQVMPATGWLWHQQQDPGGREDSALQQDWTRVAGTAKSAIEIYPPAFYYQAYRQPQSQAAALSARTFSGNPAAPWRVASFSALTARNDGVSNFSLTQPVNMATKQALSFHETREPHTSIHDFPAGARAGEFFHQLLENLDFRQSDYQRQVERYLKLFGFEAEWQDTVCQTLDDVLHTPLPAEAGAFCLADIETSARLNELEFYFPLEDFDAATLNRQLTPAYGGVSPELDFDTVRGFMKGYIDMVFQWQGKFYLVDYKSNRLGDSAAAYHPEALNAEMRRHHYVLQYHIYRDALRRYLQHRQPQQEPALGGVFYLFLRGMPNEGVFYAPPPGRC